MLRYSLRACKDSGYKSRFPVLKFDKTVADKKYYFVETLNPMEAPFISFEVKEGEYVYISRGEYVLHCVEYKDVEKVEETSNIQSKINESQAN